MYVGSIYRDEYWLGLEGGGVLGAGGVLPTVLSFQPGSEIPRFQVVRETRVWCGMCVDMDISMSSECNIIYSFLMLQ